MSEPVKPCYEDHMHEWHRSATEFNWICTNQTRDNPEPVDAYEATITEYHNYVWTAVKPPVLKGLAQLVADAKNDLVADVQSSVLGKLMRETSPSWLEAARNHEAKKDLYGNYRNYQAMVSAIQDLNRGRG